VAFPILSLCFATFARDIEKREFGTFHVKLLGDIGATPYIRPSLAFPDVPLPAKCM
jgi:hypothetical protein